MSDRSRMVLGLAVVISAGWLGLSGLGSLRGGETDFNDPHTDSQRARALLLRWTGVDSEQGFVVLVQLAGDRRLAHRPAIVTNVDMQMRRVRGVREVIDRWSSHDPHMLSHTRRLTYVVATLGAVSQDETAITRVVAQRLRSSPQLRRLTTLGGETATDAAVNAAVNRGLTIAEELAFPVLLIALVFVFRGLSAALIPVVCAAVTLLVSVAVLRALTYVVPVSLYSLDVVSALAVGLSIDYGLLVLSRYREERAGAASAENARKRAMGTAGRTTAMSAMTLSIALCSLLLFPQRFLYSVGIGGIVATVTAALVGWSLLPAMLRTFDRRLAGRTSGQMRTAARWRQWALYVTRRPLRFAVLGCGLLIAAGTPFLHARFVGVDASVLPQSVAARRVANTLNTSFAAGSVGEVQVIATTRSAAAITRYARRMATTSGIAWALAPRRLAPNGWEIEAVTKASPLSAAALSVIRRLRRIHVSGVKALVGGTSANFLDLQQSIVNHIPLAFVVLALAMLSILFAVTCSVVLPLKTFALNALTISAVFGLLVVIFQRGLLADALGFQRQDGIETTQPILLFATTFGLATDYALFLLSRIKEAHERGVSNKDAVVHGVERTGHIVTSAALLFSIAVGFFASSSLVFLKELGLGIVIGVLIDAFIVRVLLVPAAMVLFGEWNWWCPRSLRMLHIRLGFARLLKLAVLSDAEVGDSTAPATKEAIGTDA